MSSTVSDFLMVVAACAWQSAHDRTIKEELVTTDHLEWYLWATAGGFIALTLLFLWFDRHYGNKRVPSVVGDVMLIESGCLFQTALDNTVHDHLDTQGGLQLYLWIFGVVLLVVAMVSLWLDRRYGNRTERSEESWFVPYRRVPQEMSEADLNRVRLT